MAGKAAAMGSPRLIVFGRLRSVLQQHSGPRRLSWQRACGWAGPLVHALGGALAPPSLTFESCVCTRVCVHIYGLTLAQADGIHTNRSRRPGGRGVWCVCALCGLWVC